MKYDAVIIGSGLGGLQCGLILARRGMKVLILERQSRPGGCMQSYRRKDAWLDTGMHYVGGLGVGGCLYAPFRNLGLMDLPWVHLDPSGFDRVAIGEQQFRFVEGYDAFADTLSASFPHERAGLTRYARLMQQMAGHIFDRFMPAQDTNPASSRAGFEQDTPYGGMEWPWSRLYETGAYPFLRECFHDDLLMNVLAGTSLKMELRQESLPLFTFAEINSSYIQSAWRLQGDGSIIVNRLLEQYKACGGELICSAEVVELIERNGALVAARCSNGECYEALRFISDVHPALTLGWIKDNARIKKIYRNRIVGSENTYGMLTVSLLIKPGMLKYFNWNQYVYSHPAVWRCHEATDQAQGILVSCRCPADASVADGELLNNPDARIVDILTPMPWSRVEAWSDSKLGNRPDEYKAMKQRWAESCIALAEQVIPGLTGMIESYFVSTPLTYRDYTCTPQGSAYGVRKDYRQPMMNMISPRTPIPNLFLTGQSLTLHGLLGVTMSAMATISEILGKEAAWELCRQEV